MSGKLGRGDEARRPTGWVVRFIDRRAAEGWSNLLTQARENLDRAWLAVTFDPSYGSLKPAPVILGKPTSCRRQVNTDPRAAPEN